jgi:DNA-binding transcriptional LysR family regulator
LSAEFTVSQLRHFLLVADLKSYRVAAEHAHRTQPALTLSIQELERRLGHPLFEPGRKVELTALGERCLPIARELVAHYDRVRRELAALAEHRAGSVRLAAVPSVAGRLLPPVLAAFAADHPEVRLELTDANANVVQALVARREVDFGITSVWNQPDDLAFESLLEDDIGVVCRSDHPLASRKPPLRWADVAGERVIHNGTTRLLWGTPAETVIGDARLAVSNMISLIAMLESGLGITTLPRLAEPADNPRLVFLAMASPRIRRRIGLLQPVKRTLSPAAALLRERVVVELRRHRR